MTDEMEPIYPPTETIEEATEAGYLGTHVDQTPNETYTVEGVTTDEGTPKSESKPKSKSKGGDD